MSARQVLILQGPPGRFFRDLAGRLTARGCCVHRINFNGGDLADWGGRGHAFKRGVREWPTFLARFVKRHAITDVVLFGDCRPLHRIARATAAGLGLYVHVFEEGYLRPDWITLERGGVNGFSPLPADPDWYLRASRGLEPLPHREALPSAFAARAKAAMGYYSAALALGWLFPNGRSHRPWSVVLEAAGWAGRLVGKDRAAARDTLALERLADAAFFLLPLQLDSDYQLRAHSDFGGMQPALGVVLASFARCAPADRLLAIKQHPLDNGLSGWRRRVATYADALGVADRVVFLEGGDIGRLVQKAAGLVTVNSTTGALALEAGVAVKTLGRAVYDIAGLTHAGDLDGFWTSPQPPSPELYAAFRRVLAETCLLPGGFYDASTRASLTEAAAERILTGPGASLGAMGLTLVEAEDAGTHAEMLVPTRSDRVRRWNRPLRPNAPLPVSAVRM